MTTLEYEESKRGDGYTTNLVESETIGGVTYRYTRNAVGNITQVEESTDGTDFTTTEHYRYDSNNQLVFESNAHAALTREYTYDKGGNIAEIKERDRFVGPDELSIEAPLLGGTNGVRIIGYRYSTSGWADLLTSYNSTGTIEYDEIGNPLTYRDGMTLTWEGRQLKTLVKDGTTSTYTYDADGLRIKKTAGSLATVYQYVNGQLLRERRSNGVVLRYMYDALGNLSCIRYTNIDNWTKTFFVRCNSSGDVTQIYDTSGNFVASYTYDAWGNTVAITDANGKAITASTHVAVVNPIRYRGYYWDAETGFYYLQSRYFDPEIKRFISADDVELLLGGYQTPVQYNFFAYCFNNPINMSDSDGNWALALAGGGYLATTGAIGAANAWNPVGWVILGVAAVTTVVVVTVTVYNYAKTASKKEADPYARPGQKKQGRERKSKARQNGNWKPRSNPKPPKKHTPGRAHRKYK